MTDKWHWLRHKWTKWELYVQEYRHLMPDIRQQRRCVLCGFVQDGLVASNTSKMPTAKPAIDAGDVYAEYTRKPSD